MYSLESWQDRVAILKLRGAHLEPLLRERHDRPAISDATRLYTVAMPAHAVREVEHAGIQVESQAPSPRGRDLVIRYLKRVRQIAITG